MPTIVVNIKYMQSFDPLHNPNHVYIGREHSRFPESKWHNPFVVGLDGTLGEVLEKYEQHVYASGLIKDIDEIRDKVLGCWCKPEPCHGDILMRLLKYRVTQSKLW